MNLTEHAREELKLLKQNPDVSPFSVEIIKLIERFESLNMDDFAKAFARCAIVAVVEDLLNGRPLTPLTGKEYEWMEEDANGVALNKRDCRVFKKNGKAFFSEAIIFVDENNVIDGDIREVDGVTCCQPIEFPVTPKSRHVTIERGYKIADPDVRRELLAGI